MSPDHGSGVADETPEVDHGFVVGMIEFGPGHAALQLANSGADRLFVQPGGSPEQLDLCRSLDPACIHHRVVAVGDRHAVHCQQVPETQVIKGNPTRSEPKIGQRLAAGRSNRICIMAAVVTVAPKRQQELVHDVYSTGDSV